MMLQGTENKSWRELVRTHTSGGLLGVESGMEGREHKWFSEV